MKLFLYALCKYLVKIRRIMALEYDIHCEEMKKKTTLIISHYVNIHKAMPVTHPQNIATNLFLWII